MSSMNHFISTSPSFSQYVQSILCRVSDNFAVGPSDHSTGSRKKYCLGYQQIHLITNYLSRVNISILLKNSYSSASCGVSLFDECAPTMKMWGKFLFMALKFPTFSRPTICKLASLFRLFDSRPLFECCP